MSRRSAQRRAMLQPEFEDAAYRDFIRVLDFLGNLNPLAGADLGDTLTREIEFLCKNPGIGRPYPAGESVREWIVGFRSTAYIIRYAVRGDVLIVLRIWSGREDRP